MDQAVDDSNQAAIGQRTSVAAFNSAECFARAFHASPFVQAITEFESGRYLYVNDCFVRVAGYAREEVIGKTSLELGLLADNSDLDWLKQALRQRGRLTRKKLRFRVRSGDVRIGLFNAEMIRLDGEDLILSTVSDISEQLSAQHRYRLQKKRVALIEKLAAALAHEVRNPLAGIKGVADAFLERRRLTDQEREWMEAVRGEVLKIDARLKELLDLTQPRVSTVKQWSLNTLLKRVVLLASHQANSIPGRKIDLESVDLTNGSLNLVVDAAQIEDAILNLLVNAIESIEESGNVTVKLSRRRNGAQHDEAVIEVIDSGCGIDEENC
ncbi:MAG TPA: PAS domain S-box protein, partial [Pyrinomonadaceae bacterium]|nr:PAS domain S-box protein [Pyrinomonadaceae bacterium]